MKCRQNILFILHNKELRCHLRLPRKDSTRTSCYVNIKTQNSSIEEYEVKWEDFKCRHQLIESFVAGIAAVSFISSPIVKRKYGR
ncbi:unnamed protein product [Allacma fusca]|uniref:Uncharacterized protein n=1 Tax=Allacma fusca TaxID=39272 RepID=A0A8J2KZ06_9HEXA|nr:unnamed protein product [Allacma fusca]